MAIHHPERVMKLAVTGANARFDGYTAENQEWARSFDPAESARLRRLCMSLRRSRTLARRSRTSEDDVAGAPTSRPRSCRASRRRRSSSLATAASSGPSTPSRCSGRSPARSSAWFRMRDTVPCPRTRLRRPSTEEAANATVVTALDGAHGRQDWGKAAGSRGDGSAEALCRCRRPEA